MTVGVALPSALPFATPSAADGGGRSSVGSSGGARGSWRPLKGSPPSHHPRLLTAADSITTRCTTHTAAAPPPPTDGAALSPETRAEEEAPPVIDAGRAAAEEAADAAVAAGAYRPPFRPAGAPPAPSARPARLFSDYRHVPSAFSRGADAAREEAWQGEARALAGPFVPAGSAHRLKHETLLGGGSGGFKYPTLATGDPYGGHLPVTTHGEASATSVSARHPAPFKPAGRRRACALSRRALPDILKALHAALLRDWSGAAFGLLALPDDTVAARFAAAHVGDGRREALRAYMTSLARAPRGVGADFSLSIALDDWNRAPGDGWVYFLLRPPWVAPPRVRCGYGYGGGGYGGRRDARGGGSSVGSVDDDLTLRASATFSMIEGGSGCSGGDGGSTVGSGGSAEGSVGSAGGACSVGGGG